VCVLFLQIHLGHTIAEKSGSSGKTCLGGVAFRADYLTDVATGSDKTSVKVQKRCVCLLRTLRFLLLHEDCNVIW
jgi:hypothetical protein